MNLRHLLSLSICLSIVGVSSAAADITVTGTIRDFRMDHPDFENFAFVGDVVTGMVETVLGPDEKPVWTGTGPVTSQESFDQWYRDVPTVNSSTQYSITLEETNTPDIFRYSNNAFFPIDNLLQGNEGNAHNYHFTYELSMEFTYQAGQSFSFTGDDDVWVFIDDTLAVDLGGVHSPAAGSVDLDTLGLTAGQNYDLNFFFAERHRFESNFTIETSIATLSTIPEPGSCSLLLLSCLSYAGFRRRR